MLAVPTVDAFVSNVDPSGHARRWDFLPPSDAVHTNVFNPRTKAVRFYVAADAYSATNTAAELNAVRASFGQWQSIPGTVLKFEEGGLAPRGADINASDQTNVIYWARSSTFVNGDRDNIFGTLALTYPRTTADNILLEADIVLNGVEFAWFTDIDDVNNPDQSIEATVLHEIGHFIGLEHSPVGGATMFFRGTGGISTQAGLSSDEIAAAQTLYPAPESSVARAQLRGQIVRGGTGVFGAMVVAEDSAGNIASGTVTDVNGRFQLPQLTPGAYQVRVAPLDPPSSSSLTRLTTGSDIAPAFAGADTTFLPVTTPPIVLAGSETKVVSLPVAPGNPLFRITRIRPPARAEDPPLAINAPGTIRLGQSNLVVGVYSPDLPADGATLKISGDGLTLGSPTLVRDAFPGSNPSLHLISIPISVSANATPGLRSFAVQQSTNTAYAHGFLEILPPRSDANFDGLDDSFQRRYFPLFTSPEAGANADPDGDGMVNFEEHLAGTNPTNALSVLRIDHVTRASGFGLVTWRSEPGKIYQVFQRAAFGGDSWRALGFPITATGLETTFQDISATNQMRFYRLQVLP